MLALTLIAGLLWGAPYAVAPGMPRQQVESLLNDTDPLYIAGVSSSRFQGSYLYTKSGLMVKYDSQGRVKHIMRCE